MPKVSLNVRHPGEKFVLRAENEWPLERTQWTKYYLQPEGHGLSPQAPGATATLDYDTTGDGLTFSTPPMEAAVEITGPVAAKLWLSSPTTDADRHPGAARLRPERQGSHLHRLERPARAGRARLAARLAAQARSAEVAALPALAQPRRRMAAQARRAGRTRHRNLADLDRGAARLSARADRARQGLRSRRPRHRAAERALSDERRRPVPAYRSRRSAGEDLCHPQHAALCRGPRSPISCCRSFRTCKLQPPQQETRQQAKELPRVSRERRMPRHWLWRLHVIAAAAIGLAFVSTPFATPALAQAYPSRTVSIIVPYPAGGPADESARTLAQFLSDKLKQSFIVENVPGGNTIVGMEKVARATADGSTLLFANLQISANVTLYKNLPFDTVKDFVAGDAGQSQPADPGRPHHARAQDAAGSRRADEEAAAESRHSRLWRDRPSRHALCSRRKRAPSSI